jgi:hypothetical protein
MTDGLKKIYGKEFVVGRPHMTGNPGFGYHYEAKAYPKDNPDVKFTVAYNMNQKGDYGENYLEKLWTNQGKHDLEKSIRQIYGQDAYVDYSFRYNNIKYKYLTHSEVMKVCNGLPAIDIQYYIYTHGNIDKKKEAEKAYNILKSNLLDYNIMRYFFTVTYLSYSFKNEFEKNGYVISKDLDKLSFDDLHRSHKLINYLKVQQITLNPDEIKKVNINDVEKSFMY